MAGRLEGGGLQSWVAATVLGRGHYAELVEGVLGRGHGEWLSG